MPAANRLPHSSKVSRCRSCGSSSASRQFRRKALFGWLVTRRSMSFGLDADTVADRVRHLGHLTVAAGQHLGDLAFGETDEPSPGPACHHLRADSWKSPCRRRIRRRCGIRCRGSATCPTTQPDRRRHRRRAPRPVPSADGLLVEDRACGVLRDGDQRRLALPRLDQGAGHVHSEDEGRTSAVVQSRAPNSASCQGDALSPPPPP